MKLINPLPDSTAYLYHYTSCDTALEHILKNGTLKLNPFRNVNDPRESKNWDISPVVNERLNLDLEEYKEISFQVSQILKSNAKLACFTRDDASAENKWQPEALLGRGFTKPSMWHHYANAHNGVCLMFNRDKLNYFFETQLNNQRLFHDAVTYTNSGILPNLQQDPYIIDLLNSHNGPRFLKAIQKHFDRWHKHLFLHKLYDWSNEREYRFVYLDEHPDPRYVRFGESLEAIVIGEGVDGQRRDEILKQCVKHEADVAELEWHNGYPRITRPGQPYITHRHLLDE